MESINCLMFLNYIKRESAINVNCISSIRFNKSSISLTIDKDMKNHFFNSLFTEKSLYNLILNYFILWIKENSLPLPKDKDYLEYKYQTLKINWK